MSEPAAANLRQAMALVEIRRYHDAIGLLGQLIASQPGEARPRCLLAQCLLGLDDPAGALDAASGAVGVEPELEWGHRLRSIALLRLKRKKEALAAAHEAVRLSPMQHHGYIVLSDAEVANRHWDSAEAAAQRAAELAPDRAEGLNALGLVALRRSHFPEAEQYFRLALGREPENARAMNNLGVALVRQGRRPQAIHYFAEASRLDPRLSTSRRNAVSAAKAGSTALVVLVVIEAVRVAGSGFNAGVAVSALIIVTILGAAVILNRRQGRPWLRFRRRPSGQPVADDPEASKELIRQLRREAPALRGRALMLTVAPIVLVVGGSFFLLTGLETRPALLRAALVVLGLACFAGLGYLMWRVRRPL
jgi:tetratricopeptide (TPR) repeat protein